MTTLDKLKSIAEKSGQTLWLVCAADKRAVEDVCSALKVAIAQLEIYEGAIEKADDWISRCQCVVSEKESDWKFARQAKLDAEKLGEDL